MDQYDMRSPESRHRETIIRERHRHDCATTTTAKILDRLGRSPLSKQHPEAYAILLGFRFDIEEDIENGLRLFFA